MHKIKILGIAPYEGLRNLMEQVAEKHEIIELHTIVADKSDALDYIKDLDESLFDAIISRGGTATSIKELVSIPVFDILVSYYDVFNILKLAESLNDSYCMVCYPSLAEKAQNICHILDYDVKIYVTESWEDSNAQVEKAIADGYEMILGDVSAAGFASQKNVGSMLITTGLETVEESFDRVIDFFSYFIGYQSENLILRNYVTLQQELLIVYDSSDKLIYSSVSDLSVFLKTETRKLLRDVRKNGSVTITKRNKKRAFIINGSQVTIRDEECVQFVVGFKDVVSHVLSGSVAVVEEDSERTALFSYLFKSSYYRQTREQVSFLSESSVPVFLSGPNSVGKEDIARMIFKNSRINNRMLFSIECQTLTEKELNTLIDSVSSPLHENNCTFFFNHAHALTAVFIDHLISFFLSTEFAKRNRVIFSWQTSAPSASGNAGMSELINKIGCSVISVPSLRQIPGVIPKLAALYINDLNTAFSRQIFGAAPEAISMLQSYDWPFNLGQLRRVLRESYQKTDDPYITADSINAVLEREKRNYYMSAEAIPALAVTGTLEEITQRIVMQVFREENYNQSRTAERLGISRTTLWRMLKDN